MTWTAPAPEAFVVVDRIQPNPANSSELRDVVDSTNALVDAVAFNQDLVEPLQSLVDDVSDLAKHELGVFRKTSTWVEAVNLLREVYIYRGDGLNTHRDVEAFLRKHNALHADL